MTRNSVVKTSILAFSLIMIWCVGHRAYAQVGQGASATLTGRVTDSTGAVVPGASLTLAYAGGGLPETTKSNDVGYYTFPGLSPGSYKLTVSRTGFGDVVIPVITLEVQQTANVDVTLNPGTVTQQITVSAGATALQTQTSELSGTVSSQIEQQLPLTFRDPSQLINLVAGVSADMRGGGMGASYADSGGISYQGRLDFKINGGTNEQAIAMVDGVDVTIDAGNFSSVPIITTPDNTQEFKAMTNDYSAQFGRGAGVLNIVTKSGTNSLHGSVYEFLQNNVLDANDLFSNAAGQPLPHEERNQYGFAVGGPVWLPHLYDGRNKTFWFMDLERLDQTRFLPLVLSVPSAAEREGNFSNLYSTDGTPITIYNTADTTTSGGTVLRVPFEGNQLPSVNAFATNISNYWPLPNSPGVLAPNGGFTGVSDYLVAGSAPLTFDRYDIKVDHNISDANRLMWRYSKSLYHVVPVDYLTSTAPQSANSWGYTTRNNIQNGYNMVLSDTWTLSPTMVVTNAINWSRFIDGNPVPVAFDPTPLGGPFASGAITAYANAYDGGPVFPSISVGSYATMGNGFGEVFTEPYSNYEYELGIVKTRGKHTISGGFEFNLLQAGSNFMERYGSSLSFAGGWTDGPNPLNPTANTGNGLADLELGEIGGGSIEAGYSAFQTSKYFGFYLQDDIKLTPKFTANLGLRYDFTTPYTERHNNSYYFVPTLANPLGNFTGPNTNGETINQYLANLGAGPVLGAEQFVNSPGSTGRSIVPTDWTNLSPRLGFAYSVRKNVVVRGGWAKLFMLNPLAPGPIPAGNGAFSATTPIVANVNGINPNVPLANPYPNGFIASTGSSQGLLSQVGLSGLIPGGDAWHTPFSYQWNFGVQTQLPGDATISVAYAGTTSHYLNCPFFSCGNQVPYPLVQKYGSQLTQSVPNPYYGVITNPSALLSQPTVQMGQLLTQWGAFPGLSVFLPPIQGPGVNQDLFQNAFNALEVQYTKHFSHGLSLQVAYTWSKNLTNADAAVGSYLGPVVGYQNETTFAGEWSPSAESVPQRLVIGHVYDLPFGKGEHFGSSWPAPMDKVLGHWQFAGISTIQSGYPLGVTEAGHTTGAFGGGDRPNLVANPCLSGQSRSQLIQNGGLNAAAFSVAAPYSFGDAPRTLSCLSDPIKNFDWSLIKFIPIKEKYTIEFRSEFFNAFNRPQLAQPDTTFNASGFGLITSQANSPRVIQFGLRVKW
jgi:hypothetical protein